MSNYRAYIVGRDGRFDTFEVIEVLDDGTAVEKARQYVNGRSVELWELDRKIAVLPSDEQPCSE